MAIYTLLAKPDIDAVLDSYGLFESHSYSFKGIAMGTVNTYYKITFADNQSFFLKIDEVGDKKRLENELAILALLHKHQKKLGYETPFPLKTKKQKFYIPWQNKFILIFPEIEGKILFENKLDDKKLFITGKALAKLHRLSITAQIKSHRFDIRGQCRVFAQIKSRLFKKLPHVHTQISSKLGELKKLHPNNIKNTLIHADLFAENIHWVKGKLHGILDFEAGGRGEPLFDVGVALHALCHNGKSFSEKKVKAFMNGYFSARKLGLAEKKSFSYFLDYSAMRFLLTRLRDFELVDGPVKAEPFKDYREYINRFEDNKKLMSFAYFKNFS